MAPVDVQDTPNPRARRFVLEREVQQDSRGRLHRTGEDSADPQVAAVLAVPGVVSVLTLPSSMTVSVADPTEWERVTAAVVDALDG
ncbi:hypothetical protein BH23ACT9_BH23ACT9_15550 [soil metagenome]